MRQPILSTLGEIQATMNIKATEEISDVDFFSLF